MAPTVPISWPKEETSRNDGKGGRGDGVAEDEEFPFVKCKGFHPAGGEQHVKTFKRERETRRANRRVRRVTRKKNQLQLN